jgi:hypothetical protein
MRCVPNMLIFGINGAQFAWRLFLCLQQGIEG